MKIFENLKFWSIKGFVKIHHYRFIGNKRGTLIFNIDIMMIIFVLKHPRNPKSLRPLEKLHLAPILDSDKYLNKTRKHIYS